MGPLEKPENLSCLAKILFELLQKKSIRGGVKLNPPPQGQKGLIVHSGSYTRPGS